MEVINGIRNVRAETGVAPSKKIKLYIAAGDVKTFRKNAVYIKKLCNVEDIIFISDKSEITEKTAAAVFGFGEVLIPLGELVDLDKEISRLKKELEGAEKEIERGQAMLSNQKYLEKAPKALIDKEKEKLETNLELKNKLLERIYYLKS